MDITTTLPSPSSSRSIAPLYSTINLSLIALILCYSNIYLKTINSNSNSNSISNNNNEQDNTPREEDMIGTTTDMIFMLIDQMLILIHDQLPRIVAASFTYHIGFCCMFVGLAHLKWIAP